jgi:cytochrome d ubiquinol oxidase subunit II
MGFVWFWIVAVMVAAYVVLDGFDIGVGILYPLLAHSEQDRRVMMRSIGPVWDGNEVWLLAGGGTLYFAFPLLYASAFSGFYLPLMIVLWLLIGRVPIGADSYFFLPLWTNWRVGPNPGILDWYTVIGGLVAFIALAVHGALYLATKATGDLEARAAQFAERGWFALCAITAVSLPATIVVRRSSMTNYTQHPVLFAVPVLVLVSLAGIKGFSHCGEYLKAFLSSCLYLTIMLVGACVGLYPTVLPSSVSAASDITIAKALSGTYTTHVGLIWWSIGMVCALGYFFVTYSMFRGKITDTDSYGH